jgi:hypothetical protein
MHEVGERVQCVRSTWCEGGGMEEDRVRIVGLSPIRDATVSVMGQA